MGRREGPGQFANYRSMDAISFGRGGAFFEGVEELGSALVCMPSHIVASACVGKPTIGCVAL